MTRVHPNHRPASSLPPELRRTSVPTPVREWVRRQTGSEVSRAVRLAGASSAALHRLDLSDGSRVVVRRYLWPGYVEAEPLAPSREIDAMVHAGSHGLPVPEIIGCDLEGNDVGDGIPVVLMTYLPGRAVATPDLGALAEAAAAVHAVDPADFGHAYFPWYEAEMVTAPPLTAHPHMWEQAIDLWKQRLPAYRPAFIHRDFHPGNVLWSRRRLTGIVDWASACRGPIGCDLAHCRANLRDLAGPTIADRFVSTYTSLTGIELDPFWVMAGHLEHDHVHWTRERLALDEPDLERALAEVIDRSGG